MERRRNNPQRGRRHRYAAPLALVLLLAICCTSCAGRTPDNSNLIITEKEPEKAQYTLVAVSVGDVVLTERIRCTYLQTEEEDISFSVSGRQISRILVRSGDSVEKGQLLAELVNHQADSRIEELEYQIARNKLLLEYSKQNEENEISARQLQFTYRSGGTEEERKQLQDSISQLQQNYQRMQEDYQDAIDLDQMELETLQEENAVSRLYAGMDGTISWVKGNLEGSTCVRDEVIIKIIDGSKGLFVVEGTEHAKLFEEGVPVEVSIGSGLGADKYQLLPYMPENWEERLTFSVLDEYGSGAITVGATGVITMVLGRRGNVLTLPTRAVHMAEDKPYVYVVGEGNVREVRWIEIGLQGDDSVEIKEGLEAGEKVILK